MIPHRVDYQLLILVLLWLCVILPHLWPSPPHGIPKRPAASIKPNPKRATAPKSFTGLTQKPHCTLCEQETRQSALAPPVRPDPMSPTHHRPRTVETSQHFCPHGGCRYRASQPRHPPTRGGGGPPREHPVPRRRGPAGSAGGPDVPQLQANRDERGVANQFRVMITS